nr:integrase, catalytic region, zinc finger, CCHC-type, peptidase aspartic, catalytic [Tanacetum cinerariifolium]
KKQKTKVSFKENQMKYQPKVTKPKKVESHKILAIPKPRKSRLLLRWSPTGRLFDQEGKIADSSESISQSDYVIQICLWCVDSGCSKHMTGNLKLLIKFVWEFMGTVRFKNDHVAAILGQFCDSDLEVAFRRDACFVRNLEGVDLLKGDRSTNLYTINLNERASTSPICLMARASSTKYGYGINVYPISLITRVYFVEGLGHNLFSVGQICDSDLEVAFRRDACFVRNLEGVDLLKGDHSTNLYTINLHEMASASPICLMARASSTKSCYGINVYPISTSTP